MRLFTSECVSPGHPDKVADQISDAILDAFQKEDENSRVAVETMVTSGLVILSGEVSTNTYVDIDEVVRNTIENIGYTYPNLKFCSESIGIMNHIHEQSSDIAQGVDTGGAGDQGMMFGGACLETKELMPLPITISRKLINKYTKLMKEGKFKWARPDAKSQVTVKYDENENVLGIHTIVMSVNHSEDIELEDIRRQLIDYVITPILEKYGYENDKYELHVNPTGKFIIGGPHADTGLTGRKIIVDTYGGYFSHGGGAFSGKDGTKVDRSGAYLARYIAKNVIASGLARKCEVELAYAIGIAEPVSLHIKLDEKHNQYENAMINFFMEQVDLTPKGIIEKFKLKKPKERNYNFYELAGSGHLGNSKLPWEQTDLAESIGKYVSLLGI